MQKARHASATSVGSHGALGRSTTENSTSVGSIAKIQAPPSLKSQGQPMTLLQTVIGLPFVKSFVLGQARNGAAIAGGYFVTHGLSAGYSQDQIVGALCCLAAIMFQGVDNYVVHGKIVVALNTPVPAK